MDRWYTITIVEHDGHPKTGDVTSTELINATVLPHLAGSVLRTTADDVDPAKPKTRGDY